MLSRPTVAVSSAPAAGPTMKAAHEAPSMYPLTLANRSGSSVRYGAKEAIAVYTGVPTNPRRKVITTIAGMVSAKIIPIATGMKRISPPINTRRGSNRSTRTPGDRGADQCGDAESGHDRGHFARGCIQLEGGLAPDPDEEGSFATDPGDEAGGNDPDDVTICPHRGHATAGGRQNRLE